MFLHLMLFLVSLWAPDWMRDQTPDAEHFHRRRFTNKHRNKRKRVRYIWLSAATLWCLNPSVPMMIFVGLLSTFLSFSLLDESS